MVTSWSTSCVSPPRLSSKHRQPSSALWTTLSQLFLVPDKVTYLPVPTHYVDSYPSPGPALSRHRQGDYPRRHTSIILPGTWLTLLRDPRDTLQDRHNHHHFFSLKCPLRGQAMPLGKLQNKSDRAKAHLRCLIPRCDDLHNCLIAQ